MTDTQRAAGPRTPIFGSMPALLAASLVALLLVAGASAAVLERRDPGEKVAEAAAATLAEGTAHLHLRVTGAFGGASSDQELDADVDFTGRRYVLGGDVAGKRLESRVIDGTAYIAGSELDATLPRGKRWLRISTAAAGSALPLDQIDPTQLLEALRDGQGEASAEGSEDLGGESVEHYRVELEAEGLPETVDVFVAADGLIRRLEYDFRTQTLTGQVVSDLSDYGMQVTVTTPDQGEVADAPPEV